MSATLELSNGPYTGKDNLEAMTDARNYNEFLVREVLDNGRGASTAVDFGAGTGTFSVVLRDHGLAVTCVELDTELRESLQARGFDCVAHIEDLPSASVEYLFSMNVLEHIEDDGEAIQLLYQRLKPGGTMYLYVPAFPMLYSAMDRKVGHFRRYRLGGLVERLEAAGFQVVKARYVDSVGFFATVLYQLAGNRRGDLNRAALRIFDRFLFPWNAVLDRIFGHLCGKNIAITAKRPLR